MKKITITVKHARRGPVMGRHPWVFSGALKAIPEGVAPGTPVDLIDEKDKYMGSGYFNSYSQITVRLWSYKQDEKVDEEFFRRRIQAARSLRELTMPDDTNAYRLINGEGDMLPGLIVDKYDKYLAVQFYNRGIEAWRDIIVKVLIDEFAPDGIYERSEGSSRRYEGAESVKELLHGNVPEMVEILESGLKFNVDMIRGQKTGFFLDQRDKRRAMMKYAEGRRVLNCFSYSGGFSVYAMAAGAVSATSVDSSSDALKLARMNMELNKFSEDSTPLVDQDVKKFLLSIKSGMYDLMILDPPAFIKDRKKKAEGLRGYKYINEQALRRLEPGGLLMTCSCSAHLSALDFRHMLSGCGATVGRSLQIIEAFGHGTDHPGLIPYTEGEYLKCFVIKVL